MDKGSEDGAAEAKRPREVRGQVFRGPRSQREVDGILARLRAWRDEN